MENHTLGPWRGRCRHSSHRDNKVASSSVDFEDAAARVVHEVLMADDDDDDDA